MRGRAAARYGRRVERVARGLRGWSRAAVAGAALASAGCHEIAAIDELTPTAQAEPAAPIEVAWTRAYGDAADQWISALAVDENDDILIAGVFRGTLDLGGDDLVNFDSRDPFVAKLGGDGGHRWSRSFEDPDTVVVTGIAAGLSGEAVVTGYHSGALTIGSETLEAKGLADAFVAVLDASGAPRWARRAGDGGYQRSTAVAVTTGGSVLLAGAFTGALDPGGGAVALTSAGGDDGFLVKYSGEGVYEWAERYGDAEDQQASALAISADNDIHLAGTLYGAIDLGGVVRTGPGAPFVAKLDPSADHLWSGSLSAERTCFESCEVALARGEGGTLVVAAAFAGTASVGGVELVSDVAADVMLVKLDRYGGEGGFVPVWAKRLGGDGTQRPYGLAVAPDGTIAVAGVAGGTVDLGAGPQQLAADAKDAFVAIYEADGTYRASLILPITAAASGDSDQPSSPRIAFDSAGDLIVAGSWRGGIEIGGEALDSAGPGDDHDVFVVKLRVPGG